MNNSTSAFLFVPTVIVVTFFVISLVALVATWRVYSKAGNPGWAALIPIYNIYVLLKIAGRPGWWFLLFLIPLVNIIISLIVSLDLAKVFGRSGIFGFFLLWLFPLIGYLILGFGKSQYLGASSGSQPVSTVPPQAPPEQHIPGSPMAPGEPSTA